VQGFVLVTGNAPRSPCMGCMRGVASTRPGLKHRERRVGHAEHGIVDGMVTVPDGFIPRSIKQRKDQKGGSAFGPSNETTISRATCSKALSLSLSSTSPAMDCSGCDWFTHN
jgi:hypothetical protein